jgi:putative membrane protein
MDRRSEVFSIRGPESFVIFLKGMLMGMADIVPGVSGGTMALITGIYERFIHALRSLSPRFILLYLWGDKEDAKKIWRKMDLPLLGPLLLGIVVAIILFAQIISWLLDDHSGPTYAFFFGLILASAGFVYKYVEHINVSHLASGALGFLLVVVIVGIEEVAGNHSLPVLFVSGAIAICAMILPGISGSLILLIMGQYEYMLEVLNKRSVNEIIVFGAGAVVGILVFSRILDHMLKHHRSVTMAFLFGCMLGALRLPGEEIWAATDPSSMVEIALVGIAAGVGFLAVFALERRSGDIKERLGIEDDDV